MRLLATSLLNLPVVTESGIKLGRVSDIDCNVDGWTIGNLQVESGWFNKVTSVIAVTQIVRVETTKVVVRDALAPVIEKATVIPMASTMSPSLNSTLEN